MKRGECDNDVALHPAGEQSVGTEREQGDSRVCDERLYYAIEGV